MVSLPNRPDTAYTAKSFAEKIDDVTVIFRLDKIAQEWRTYLPGYDTDDGFSINGGEGYIVNVLAGKDVDFTGTVWDNASAAPALERNNSVVAWAFVVSGKLPVKQSGELTVSIRNADRNISEKCTVSNPQFRISFIDVKRRAVVRVGDRLIVEVTNEYGRIISETQIIVEPEDIANAFAFVNLHNNPIPKHSALLPNYPNPFNPETWIPFQLSESANVTISIYNISGKLIRTLTLGNRHAGIYTTKNRAGYWNGRNDVGEKGSSGIYFYRLDAGKFSAIKRMVILK